jgi:hypothetical protein
VRLRWPRGHNFTVYRRLLKALHLRLQAGDLTAFPIATDMAATRLRILWRSWKMADAAGLPPAQGVSHNLPVRAGCL